MEHWTVFDAACVVGRHCTLQPGWLHSAEDLLGEMDHFGIAEALVVDSLSREHHPADGNRRILKVAAASPRLHPAWFLGLAVALPLLVLGGAYQWQRGGWSGTKEALRQQDVISEAERVDVG